MDPEATLDELLTLSNSLLAGAGCDGAEELPVDRGTTLRVAELVEALDEWLVAGGFLPGRWAQGRQPR